MRKRKIDSNSTVLSLPVKMFEDITIDLDTLRPVLTTVDLSELGCGTRSFLDLDLPEESVIELALMYIEDVCECLSLGNEYLNEKKDQTLLPSSHRQAYLNSGITCTRQSNKPFRHFYSELMKDIPESLRNIVLQYMIEDIPSKVNEAVEYIRLYEQRENNVESTCSTIDSTHSTTAMPTIEYKSHQYNVNNNLYNCEGTPCPSPSSFHIQQSNHCQPLSIPSTHHLQLNTVHFVSPNMQLPYHHVTLNTANIHCPSQTYSLNDSFKHNRRSNYVKNHPWYLGGNSVPLMTEKDERMKLAQQNLFSSSPFTINSSGIVSTNSVSWSPMTNISQQTSMSTRPLASPDHSNMMGLQQEFGQCHVFESGSIDFNNKDLHYQNLDESF